MERREFVEMNIGPAWSVEVAIDDTMISEVLKTSYNE